MRVLFYSCRSFELPYVASCKYGPFECYHTAKKLTLKTASLAKGYDIVSIFSKDDANSKVLEKLSNLGVRMISLRSTGYNNVDLKSARDLGLKVSHVPNYSPESIAEYAILLALVGLRRYNQTRKQIDRYDFNLDNLVGNLLSKNKIGVLGVGQIGKALIRLLRGFQNEILAFDKQEDLAFANEYSFMYASLNHVLSSSKVIFINLPLNESTKYIMNNESLSMLPEGAFIINTGRGGLIHSKDLLEVLESGRIAYAGLDVYERESPYYFQSNDNIDDEVLKTLIHHPKVSITGHQAYLTHEALKRIFQIGFENMRAFSLNRTNSCFLV